MSKWIDSFIGGLILPFIFRKKKQALPKHIRRVLILRLGALGDTVLLLPALQALLDQYPSLEELHVVAWSRNADVYRLLKDPRLVLHEFSRYSSLAALFKLWSFIRRQRGRFDVVFDLEQYANLTALLGVTSKSAYFVGFDVRGQRRAGLYDATYPYNPDQHESLNFLGQIHVVFSDVQLKEPQKIDTIGLTFIGIHPGSKWPAKCWPQDRFVELVKRINLKFPDYPVHIYAGPDEMFYLPGDLHVIYRSGLSIQELAGELKQCRLFISNDNGVMHLAGWLGVSVVGIFGMSDPVQWHALGNARNVVKSSVSCAPCNKLGKMTPCDDLQCLQTLSVDQVWDSVVKVLTSG